MKTKHKVIFGNCMSMEELPDNLCHLMFTSPPYFNAPFDYQGFFKDYEKFLGVIKKFASETYRVLKDGRIAVINIDDMLVNGTKYPIVADTIKIFQEAGFRYRDKIIWKKPEERIRKLSKIDKEEFQQKKWYMTLWEITNVLPGSTLEKNIAAFPDELPYRIIKLFSYAGEIVLDPFLGSGTTMKVARKLQRHCIGFEIIRDLEETIRKKTGFNSSNITHQNNDIFEIQERKTGKYRFVKMDYIEQKKKKSSN
jgi:site-specific DNA-methyltransferase (adenine-specific)